MSEERKVQVPINCTFTIDVDEIAKHIDFSDHAEDDLQETIKDTIENSGRIEEHLQQLISGVIENNWSDQICLLYTSPSPRDGLLSRMPSSA